MKITKMNTLRLPLLMLLLGFAFQAQAHFIWLEPAEGQARLYFGEYGDNLREKTGGRLDSIAAPAIQTNYADRKSAKVAYERKDNHIALKAPGNVPLIVQDTAMKVKDLRKNNIGIVKPMYYARFATNDVEAASSLDFDIQPLGNGKVKVNLHGAPLAKVKLEIFAPNQWMREYQTNELGEVSVDTPWPGLYVVHVVYVEPVKGEYQGDAYEAIRHVGTLSLIR